MLTHSHLFILWKDLTAHIEDLQKQVDETENELRNEKQAHQTTKDELNALKQQVGWFICVFRQLTRNKGIWTMKIINIFKFVIVKLVWDVFLSVVVNTSEIFVSFFKTAEWFESGVSQSESRSSSTSRGNERKERQWNRQLKTSQLLAISFLFFVFFFAPSDLLLIANVRKEY